MLHAILSPLLLEDFKKSVKQANSESNHEKRFVGRKNEGKKPEKNSRVRRNPETSTKIGVQEFHLCSLEAEHHNQTTF